MKSSNYIAESVFKVRVNYEQMQNETEKLFFRCLDEERSPEYFEKRLRKIWGNVDHSFMNDEIEKYREIVREKIGVTEETLVEDSGDIFGLVPMAIIIGVEKAFERIKSKEYQRSIKYIINLDENNKEETKKQYINMKLAKYTNDTKLYYKKGAEHTLNNVVRKVSPAVYNAMVYNTNLTREGWNETMKVADEVGGRYFFIMYHPFSCIHCIAHQEKLLTRDDIIDIAGVSDEAEGDILHPNCKCEITIWDEKSSIPRSDLTYQQKEEIAAIRQKMNGLTLKKERIKTDMEIAQKEGLMSTYDKLNQQRNKINKEIRTLKEQLPTDSLKKQVVAIKR
jgi:hypothetical protein